MIKSFLTNIFLLFIFTEKISTSPPILIWHGMGDSCCNPISLGSFVKFLKKNLDSTEIISLRIGSNIAADTANGFFLNANHQIDYVCKLISQNENLNNGFHAIGFSQGGQFFRALAQRCSTAKILNLISIGGQHQGVFGFPRCPADNQTICDYIRHLLNFGAYESFVQNHLVQAEYWHDPHNEETYRKSSIFLADINQERTLNVDYKRNLLKIRNLILVKFLRDEMVTPIESEHFGFYHENDTTKIVPLQQTSLYLEDRLGLKTMDEQGRIKFLQSDTDHLQFTDQWFIENILPFLQN